MAFVVKGPHTHRLQKSLGDLGKKSLLEKGVSVVQEM